MKMIRGLVNELVREAGLDPFIFWVMIALLVVNLGLFGVILYELVT